LICENCIASVRKYLPAVLENGDDMQAREELMFAASSCGTVIATAYLHAGHAIGHAIGGALGITHGLAVVVIAPELLNVMAQAVPEKVRRIGELLGMNILETVSKEELGMSIRREMIELLRTWGIQNLKEAGHKKEDLYACIPVILKDVSLFNAPCEMTEKSIQKILDTAYSF